MIIKNVYSGLANLPHGRTSGKLTSGCICLEGGALRGIYTSGVLDYLMEQDMNFSCVIGVSAGAMNGLNYAAGHIGRSARINLSYRHYPRMVGLKALVESKSVFGFDFVFEDAKEFDPFDEVGFLASPGRFVAVATDLATGKPAYFEKDCEDIFQAVRASASMPFVSKPVEVDGKTCLDGGGCVHIPYQWALDQGYEKIIVIRTRPQEFRKSKSEAKGADMVYKHYPEYVEALKQVPEAYNRECDEVERLTKEGRIFSLCPSKDMGIKRLESDMEKLGEWYYLGYHDMEERFVELKEYLGS